MMAFHRRDRKEAFAPVRFNEYRDLWRDSAALFQISVQHHAGLRSCPDLRPRPGRAELRAGSPGSARYRLSVLGLCTDKAKVNFWRHESLPLPLAYLDRAELADVLKRVTALAEAVASEALRPAAWAAAANWLTANPEMKPDTDRVRAVVDSFAPDRLYWSRPRAPFP